MFEFTKGKTPTFFYIYFDFYIFNITIFNTGNSNKSFNHIDKGSV